MTTLTEIRKTVLANGGSYKKANAYLNGKQAWLVNGKLYTRQELQIAFDMGEL